MDTERIHFFLARVEFLFTFVELCLQYPKHLKVLSEHFLLMVGCRRRHFYFNVLGPQRSAYLDPALSPQVEV